MYLCSRIRENTLSYKVSRLIDFKVKIMLLDDETTALLAGVALMTVLSIIALTFSNIR